MLVHSLALNRLLPFAMAARAAAVYTADGLQATVRAKKPFTFGIKGTVDGEPEPTRGIIISLIGVYVCVIVGEHRHDHCPHDALKRFLAG